jgi:FKBP-type peptidyl-prolyl cis-trans isomerase 2
MSRDEKVGQMKVGDCVYVDLVARVKETGEIFNLTRADVARREGIYDPRARYRPIPLIVGAGWAIAGLEEALKRMRVGEKSELNIPPAKAYGERRADLLRLVPRSEFREEPVPGAWVSVRGVRGRILSVSGGRVRVDFNHPLAGKVLSYHIEIKRRVTAAGQIVKAIVRHHTGIDEEKITAKVRRGEVQIQTKERAEIFQAVRKRIADDILRWVRGMRRVSFVDVYEKMKGAAK